jgi:hypothetical protein
VATLTKMPAGLPTRAPDCHRPPVESKKAFICSRGAGRGQARAGKEAAGVG